MEMADLSKSGGKGYLLAVDRHDMYASYCGKANWAEDQIVTCHSHSYGGQQQADDAEGGGENNENNNRNNNAISDGYIHCTDTRGTGMSKLSSLKAYVKASTNNDASDDWNE